MHGIRSRVDPLNLTGCERQLSDRSTVIIRELNFIGQARLVEDVYHRSHRSGRKPLIRQVDHQPNYVVQIHFPSYGNEMVTNRGVLDPRSRIQAVRTVMLPSGPASGTSTAHR
jgi:hypothetical protein